MGKLKLYLSGVKIDCPITDNTYKHTSICSQGHYHLHTCKMLLYNELQNMKIHLNGPQSID